MKDSTSKLARLADMIRYALRVIEASPEDEAATVLDQVEQAWDLLTKAAEQLEANEDEAVQPVRIAGKPVCPPTVQFRAAA